MSDPYPSVISQEGSASRNVQPISAALSPLLPSPPPPNHHGKGARVLEIGSGSYDHLRSLGKTFPHVKWTGTVRDTAELADVQRRLNLGVDSLESNIDPPGILDIASEADWADLARAVQGEGGAFDGVLMINILHCIPPSLPSMLFQHLSPLSAGGRALLNPSTGWIAAYGPFLTDGGSYASPADAEFDATHVRAVSPLLGLRSIASIDHVARLWGFGPGHRKIMPKGNMWVVWRPSPHTSGEREGEKEQDEQERDA